MKITIDITPAELAELIFALVDAEIEIDDGEEFDEDAEMANTEKDTLNPFVQLICKILEQTNKKAP